MRRFKSFYEIIDYIYLPDDQLSNKNNSFTRLDSTGPTKNDVWVTLDSDQRTWGMSGVYVFMYIKKQAHLIWVADSEAKP